MNSNWSGDVKRQTLLFQAQSFQVSQVALLLAGPRVCTGQANIPRQKSVAVTMQQEQFADRIPLRFVGKNFADLDIDEAPKVASRAVTLYLKRAEAQSQRPMSLSAGGRGGLSFGLFHDQPYQFVRIERRHLAHNAWC